MKKIFFTLSITIIASLVLTTVHAQKNLTAKEPNKTKVNEAKAKPISGNKKILIVYFSRVGASYSFKGVDAVASASLPKGNTIVIANMIHEAIGGDMFQIVTVDPYPAAYRETTDVALKEQKADLRPKLSTHVRNMKDYDILFLGYPNWWGTLPMPVFTFLEEYNFSAKTIIPFCTHEGSYLGQSVSDIIKLCPRSTILEGLAVRGRDITDAQGDVSRWLLKIGMIK